MNKVIINIFVAFVILGLGGCATLPPPKPLDPQRAIIGISVKNRAPIRVIAQKNTVVYFIKVDKEEDLYTQEDIIQSNYANGGQVYLLNAEPGRYAAVASFYLRVGNKWTTIFPKELIKLTEVTVAPGTIAFMGDYVVDSDTGTENYDDAQSHYSRLVYTGYHYDGSLHEENRDKQAEIGFLTNALEHFKDTGWVNVIQRRMGDLEAEK